MPRLLPRILEWIEKNPLSKPKYKGPLIKPRERTRRRSLWRPPPQTVEETGKSLLVDGRTQSLLADATNIINHAEAYKRHKKLPPSVSSLKKKETIQESNEELGEDSPREMSEEEKTWWSSPYRSSFQHHKWKLFGFNGFLQ